MISVKKLRLPLHKKTCVNGNAQTSSGQQSANLQRSALYE